MRKEDIAITVPKKSTIYAIGTSPVSNSHVWEDFDIWRGRHYRPGYVLEVKDTGFALVLVAIDHPDSPAAKRHQQASELDALDYTLADYRKRQEVLKRYSHWDGNLAEGRAERDKKLRKLKPQPKGWQIEMMRTTYVRMLWAEYATELDAKIGERKIAKAKEREALEKEMEARGAIATKLVKLGLITEEQAEGIVRYSYMTTISLPWQVVEKLALAAEGLDAAS